MTVSQAIVLTVGVVLTILIAWYFWLAPKGQIRAATSASGVQEVAVTVQGGYLPDVIVVQKGRPVRLIFTRRESSTCSERILLPDFNLNAFLPEGEQVTLEFTPGEAGEHGFQCQMGMLRGKLIVEE